MANANIPQNFNLIIPVGTQIVTKIEVKNPATNESWKQGLVGVIVQSPTDNSHAYLVKLPAIAQNPFSLYYTYATLRL